MAKILNIVFRAKDETSGAIEGVEGGVGGIEDTLKGLIAPAALATAGILALKQVYEFGEEGAALQRLEDAGTRLADVTGNNYRTIIRSIEEASGHTISALDAMTQANVAMRLGVAQTPEEFEKLTKAAIALGRATGRTAAESIADLTTGVGRMSKMVLDNLGIVYEADALYAEHALSIGKVASELTDAEKKQSLLNLALESAIPLLDEHGDLIEDEAAAYERLEVGLTEYSNRLKKHTSEAIAPFIDKLADLIQIANEANLIMDEGGIIAGRFGLFYNEAGEIIALTTEDMTEKFGDLDKRLYSLTSRFGEVKTEVDNTTESIEGLSSAVYYEMAAEAMLAGDVLAALKFRRMGDDARFAREEIEKLADQLRNFPVVDIGRGLGWVEPQRGQGGGDMIRGWQMFEWSTAADRAWAAKNPKPGFQAGGSFKIGGSGGHDSQLVQFMGDPGEHVNISKEDSIEMLVVELRRLINIMPIMVRDAVERIL